MSEVTLHNAHLFCGDALDFYHEWPSPTVIVSDGPYGVNGYPGDLLSFEGLASWYEPHVRLWSSLASACTTLWFWNTEIGWASVHPLLERYGWKYVSCCVWDKGIGHIAGNTNTKTLRHLPVVTEVCAHYVKKPSFTVEGKSLSMQEWLRFEWSRSKLPFKLTNEACGVKDAATRKYFTKSNLWYMPPAEAFGKIAEYANKYGALEGRPYFSLDGVRPLSQDDWALLRAKFYCPVGVTNVWHEPQLCSVERLKVKNKAIHLNQKPLVLIKRIVEMSSDRGDVVWEPFGGLFTTAIASLELGRECYSCEIESEVYEVGVERVRDSLSEGSKRGLFDCA